MMLKFTTTYQQDDKWYVAHCVELGVTSQGETLEAAEANLTEAIELYLDDVPAEELQGYQKHPLIRTLDLQVA